MAEAISRIDDRFTCSICLDILKDPVTIPCGHSYCMTCITDFWDQEAQKGVYTCPQCRQDFTPKPILNKNNIIAQLLEDVKKIRIQVVPVPPVSVPSDDVECDICTWTKQKAVKSCLNCLLSYCERHYKTHNELNPGRKHNVVDATGQLQERVCTEHEKPLEIFCRTDQSCVCFLCMLDEHKGHDTVSAAAGRKEKQTYLDQTQITFRWRAQRSEMKLQEVRKILEILKSSAHTAVEDNERIFTVMIRSIERRRSEVTELIRAQEKAEVSRAEGLLKRLQEEIDELKRRDAELEQLSHTEDHIHFLKTFQSVSDLSDHKDSSIAVNQSLSFEAVRQTVSTLMERLNDFCNQEITKISATVSEVQVIVSSKSHPAMFQFGSTGTEKDFKFSLASTGASESDTSEKKEGSDKLAPVSLPKIVVKSGEEDEEVLFKEHTKLYRFDLESNQWKDRGVGDIKILYHPQQKLYRVVMRREKVLNVCANHFITQVTELKPAASSDKAFLWTVTDYADGRGKSQTLAAKFKTPELAESFRKIFTDCQACTSKGEESRGRSSTTK